MNTSNVSFGKLDIDIVSSLQARGDVSPEDETAFRILVLGDFSGRGSRGIFGPLKGRRILEIDRDNFDEVLDGMKVGVDLRFAGKGEESMRIEFSELDDFHPDRIFERLDIFTSLKELRKRLNDPKTFSSASDEIKRSQGFPGRVSEEHEVAAESKPKPEGGSLLDQIIDHSGGRPDAERGASLSSDIERFASSISRPYLVPKEDAGKDELVRVVDDMTSAMMQLILHSPVFQQIESAWRGLYFLISRLETGEDLRVSIVDISKEELAADLLAADDLSKTGFYKMMVEQTIGTPGGEPWALLAGNYEFKNSLKDAGLLGRIAKIAAIAGAPFIAGADPLLVGCKSMASTPDPDDWTVQSSAEDDDTWEALRRLPEAAYLGLALPRFILRLPYGEETEPVELFGFEEMAGDERHEDYLWGSPAFACAYLIGEAFSRSGWDFQPGLVQDIENFPVHIYRKQGESVMKPPAEVFMTERAVLIMLEKGLMPLLSFRGSDRIKLARFQSIADPSKGLSGRWSE